MTRARPAHAYYAFSQVRELYGAVRAVGAAAPQVVSTAAGLGGRLARLGAAQGPAARARRCCVSH